MNGDRHLKIESRLAHGGAAIGPQGSVTPPIYPSTTYIRDADGSFPFSRSYTRADNPSYLDVESLLAEMEQGAEAMVYASGMAAATAVFQALSPGDHVVAPRSMYWGLRGWLVHWCRQWGLELDLFDNDAERPLEELARRLRPNRTRLVWIETPANPTWSVIDIAAAASLAHEAGAKLGVDSTAATPLLSKPVLLGADLVMHAATKYLNGHSDVLAGVLVTAAADPFWGRLKTLRGETGAVLGPFECWLLQRGLRTLHLRVAHQSRSALAIARQFDADPRLEAVLYPGLQSHRHHAVAVRQMTGGFGGMLSLRVKGGEEAAMAAAGRLKLIVRATSFGGTESLVEHRSSIEGPDTPTPSDLLRVSVGLEAIEDLIADLDQALG